MNPLKWPPQYDSYKVILAIIVLVVLGFFAYRYIQTGSLFNTGRVVNVRRGEPVTAPTPSVPLVTILPATEITATSARLNATVPVMDQYNSATLSFMYGTTDKYGSTVTPATVEGKTSASITGLTCGTKYHYRLIAQNAVGKSGSADMAFTTPSCNGRTNLRTGAPVVR